MENNTHQPDNKTGGMPTVAEIMSEVTQISSVNASEVPSVDSIQTPSVDEIPSMPKVDAAAQAYAAGQAAYASTQPAPTAYPATQPAPTAYPTTQAAPTAYPTAQPIATAYPTAQPAPAAPIAQPLNTPYVTERTNNGSIGYAVQPVKQKRGPLKIIVFILGLLFTLAGFALAMGDVAVLIDNINAGTMDIGGVFAFIVLLLPLALGILMMVLGLKRKTVTAPVNAVPTNTAPMQTTASVPTAAPVQNTGAVTNQPGAAPSLDTMQYQYANTGMLQDESEKMLKKKARNSALGALGLLVLFWVLVFALDTFSLWAIIFPFVFSFAALKTSGGKSFLGWISMILSILSVVIFVLVMGLAIVG